MALFAGCYLLRCCTYQADKEQSQGFDWSMGVLGFERRIYFVLFGNTDFLSRFLGADFCGSRITRNFYLVHLVEI